MKYRIRSLVVAMAGVIVGLVLTASAGAASTAEVASANRQGEEHAAGAWGCQYPYACLYNADGKMVEKYKVVTSGWQTFTRQDVYYGVNTRNDDVVYIRYTNGNVYCMSAGDPDFAYYLRPYGIPNGIRISSSATC